MFRIRFSTAQVINEEGWQHLGGELVVGDARLWLDTDPDEPTREHRLDRRVEPARVAGACTRTASDRTGAAAALPVVVTPTAYVFRASGVLR